MYQEYINEKDFNDSIKRSDRKYHELSSEILDFKYNFIKSPTYPITISKIWTKIKKFLNSN